MAIRHFLKCTAAVVIAALLLIGCSTTKAFSLRDVRGFYLPDAQEELYGTWVNSDYEGGTTKGAKMVVHDTGYVESFSRLAQRESLETGVMTIVKKWRKSDATSWYITYYRSSLGGDSLGLAKISNDNTVWEGFWVSARVAGGEESLIEENLTPNHAHYAIYHRQSTGD